MAIIEMAGKTIVYCQKGDMFTYYKPALHSSYGLFESYTTPGFYWIVFIYPYHVEFIINTPMYIDDAFRIAQEHGTTNYSVRETRSIMFEDFDNLPL
ncbi:hypothetical protein [Pantoea sp. ACRSB]|uniref:hypothetical protein n=1 Tax=Pantoea sp. ACRSB TaxID=2918207 RepID=UPI002892D4F8|nr:hypothetical protein [Pantoea sp. ACRSB]MCG7387298.1 hypothetical protein [Pantoea sp. ACRSB]